MSDLKPADELVKPYIHPSQRNFGPDTTYDWDQMPWYRLQAEFYAEREGVSVDAAKASSIAKLPLDEKSFRWLFNENAMATEKTAEGIRLFNADAQKLSQFISARL